MKTCFKCGVEKPLDEFYCHSEMGDGRLNKCKECTKRDTKVNYRSNVTHYRQYDKLRSCRPERKLSRVEYQKQRRLRSPEKYKAHCAVSNAIRDGRLIRLPCQVCGNPKSEAHHTDYSKPLDVQWLCFKHHREIGHGQIVSN